MIHVKYEKIPYKRGDMVLAAEGNGIGVPGGTELKVQTVYNNNSTPYASVYKINRNGTKIGGNYTAYSFDIIPASREERIKLWRARIKDKESEIKKMQQELEFWELRMLKQLPRNMLLVRAVNIKKVLLGIQIYH